MKEKKNTRNILRLLTNEFTEYVMKYEHVNYILFNSACTQYIKNVFFIQFGKQMYIAICIKRPLEYNKKSERHRL